MQKLTQQRILGAYSATVFQLRTSATLPSLQRQNPLTGRAAAVFVSAARDPVRIDVVPGSAKRRTGALGSRRTSHLGCVQSCTTNPRRAREYCMVPCSIWRERSWKTHPTRRTHREPSCFLVQPVLPRCLRTRTAIISRGNEAKKANEKKKERGAGR